MPSPFPGMDPYLEAPEVWPDFHATFCSVVRAELNKLLPPRYVARIDRYVWIHEPDADERRLLGKPDVYVADQNGGNNGAGATIALMAPAPVTMPVVHHQGNRYIKIYDPQNR